jgi:hypothetical protein
MVWFVWLISIEIFPKNFFALNFMENLNPLIPLFENPLLFCNRIKQNFYPYEFLQNCSEHIAILLNKQALLISGRTTAGRAAVLPGRAVAWEMRWESVSKSGKNTKRRARWREDRKGATADGSKAPLKSRSNLPP